MYFFIWASCRIHFWGFTQHPNAPIKSVLQLPTSATQPLWIFSVFEASLWVFLWDSLTEISGVLNGGRRGVYSSMSVDKYTQLCNHHPHQGMEQFHHPQIPSYPFVENPQPTDLLSVSFFPPFPKFHVNGIIEHVAFESGFFRLHNAFVICLFLHASVSLFLFRAEQYSIVPRHHSLFIHAPLDELLVASVFWLLQLLQTLAYKSLCALTSLGVNKCNTGMRSLGIRVSVCLTV